MRVGWCEVWHEGELVCGVRVSWCEVWCECLLSGGSAL